MQFKLITLAASCLAVATPAMSAESPQTNSVAAKPAPEKTYCLQFGLDTGSRINRVECKTKRDWARLGVDIDEVLAK
jgi:hypothetical protein